MSAHPFKHAGLQKTVLAEAHDAISASKFHKRLTTRSPVKGRLNPALMFSMLICMLLAITVIAIGRGAFPMHAAEVLSILFAQIGIDTGIRYLPQQEAVLLSIRLPRVLLGIVAGAALAMSGAALQGLFRNPLADPALIGVSGGASLAVASVIVLGATTFRGLSQALGVYTLPLAGFGGGMAATFLIYVLARNDGRTSLVTMLLAGISVNSIAFASIGLFSSIANDEQLRNITFWSFGSLSSANARMLLVIVPPLLLAAAVLMRVAPGLNALMLGEQEAAHLGYDTQKLKHTVIVSSALCAGVVVSMCGMIGFVALVAPHMVRMICGPDNRVVVPGSALTGAILLLIADIIARTSVVPAELPIGILTALIGAPFFMALLFKQRREWTV